MNDLVLTDKDFYHILNRYANLSRSYSVQGDSAGLVNIYIVLSHGVGDIACII